MKKTLQMVITAGMVLSMSNVYAKSGLNRTKLYLYTGEKATLKIKGAKKIKWSSTNKAISVKKGVVQARNAGKATITAKAGKKTYRCSVAVVHPLKLNFTASVVDQKIVIKTTAKGGFGHTKYQYAYHYQGKKVTLTKYTKAKSASFSIKGSGNYTLEVTAKDQHNKKTVKKATLKVTSQNTSTALSSNGSHTMKSSDPAVTSPSVTSSTIQSSNINSTTPSDTSRTMQSPDITAMSASKKNILLGDEVTVQGTVDHTNDKTAYSMKVTLDDGTIIAQNNARSITFKVNQVAHYTITLTATNEDNLSAVRAYDFTTQQPLMQPGTITTSKIGKTVQCFVQYVNSDIKWTYTSSNPNVVTVDSNGLATTVGKGTAEITAFYNGYTASQKCLITVS